jgi:transcriptional regulator with XRE-family HTH domain
MLSDPDVEFLCFVHHEMKRTMPRQSSRSLIDANAKEARMDTYSFTFVVGDADPHAEDFEDRFFEAGCDDATIILVRGAAALCFDREDETFKDAVLSAYQDILKSGALILRFEPDYLVNASEIAARAGLSRNAVSMYEKGERGEGYPKPCARFTTSSPLWDWVDVSRWLCLRGTIDEEEYRFAQVSRIINHNVQVLGDFEKAKIDVEIALQSPV